MLSLTLGIFCVCSTDTQLVGERRSALAGIVLPMRELKILFAVMGTDRAASTPKEGST